MNSTLEKKEAPVLGSKRTNRKFAFFPKKLTNGLVIFWKSYVSIQEFQSTKSCEIDDFGAFDFFSEKWVEVKSYIASEMA